MKKRGQQTWTIPTAKPDGTPALTPGRWSAERWGWVIAGTLVAVLALTLAYRTWWPVATDDAETPIAAINLLQPPAVKQPPPALDEPSVGRKPREDAEKATEPDNFLDAFNEKVPVAEKEGDGTVLANEELEKRFASLVEASDQLDTLKRRVTAPGAVKTEKDYEQAEADRDRLLDQFNRRAAALEQDVARARKARPGDAIPRWLTGELLIIVGGEPDEVAPHLNFALAHGLKRPRLLASSANAQLEANHFALALATATQALDQAGRDHYLWKVYVRAAFANQQFDAVSARLDRTFGAALPAWAKAVRRDANELALRWRAEQKLRLAESLANDLPRVRLLIEHRRFAKDPSGKPLTTIESTGREEVIVELFENEAPATVANFLDLVGRKFYDGTIFHMALPATVVAGGDPLTKNGDPSDDGEGGPGYVIPDEYKSPGARTHFRGSLSMVNTGPHTAGSQFFLSLAPVKEMNGHFTVFGRVIAGQEAVDRITRGRTTRLLGHHGKIIPGDLLVRAEVLRKRDHEYRAVKQMP